MEANLPMNSSSIIFDLKKFFPEISWPQTIPALRQDAAVWAAIQDEEFRRAAMSELGSTPEAWTPANLALLSLGYKLRAEDLRNVPNSLPESLADRAQAAYDAFTANANSQTDLDRAGLIALALRNKPDRWMSLPQSPLANSALTCLFSLLHDGQELLRGIPLTQILHILLSNPLIKESQYELLEPHLESASPDERIWLLDALRSQRPNLAEELTLRLSARLKPAAPKNRPAQNTKGVTARLTLPINDLQTLLQQADLQQLAAKPEDARAALSSAQEAVERIQAALALQAAQASVQAGNAEEALSIWRENSPHPPADDSASLALVLLEHDYFDEAQSLANAIAGQTPSATTLLLETHLAAYRGDLPSAQANARKVLEIYKAEAALLIAEDDLATLLVELNLTNEAISLATRILDEQPNNAKAAKVMARAFYQAGAPDQALPWAHLSVTLDPENLPLHRDLAETLESLGEWVDALGEREAVVHKAVEFDAADHHALATCALRAGQPQRTVSVCGQVLEHDDRDGLAHTLLGQAISALGNPDQGLWHFEKAIQMTPHRPEPWLALAQAVKVKADGEKACQILLTASRAVPESAEIYLALGHAYREDNSPTKALESYQRASRLIRDDQAPLNIELTQALGDTLIALGHIEEANRFLETAYRGHPTHAGLAHAYAKTLLLLDQPTEALGPLYTALEHDPEDQKIQLDYAHALLITRTGLDQAEQILAGLSRLDPHHALAKALLAEVLEINSKDQAALEAYHQALGSELSKDPAWLERLSLGLSRVALKLNRADTALAALETAWGQNPENIEITRMLSEVYKANELPNRAMQVAQFALQANLSNLDIVIWFADLALELDAPQEALTALDKALLLDARQPRLHLRKGNIQLQLEDLPGARESFDQVLALEFSTPQELEAAAQGLTVIGDLPRAAISLERAVALCKSNSGAEKNLLIELLTRLAQTHEANHDYTTALETVEEALPLAGVNCSLDIHKAALLLKLGRLERAAAWNAASLERHPENPALNLQAARIHRAQGNLDAAFAHVQKALDGFDRSHKLSGLILKADLALGMMQPNLADQVLASQSGVSSNTPDDLLALHCMKGEMALTKDAEIAAADALTSATNIAPNHPRALALRSRLHLRQGNPEEARKVLEKALLALGEMNIAPTSSLAIHLALADAASECQVWDAALYLLDQAVKIAPSEPRPSVELARLLVLRAEHQRLCRLLKIHAHAAGEAAVSEHAFGQFEAAILSARRALDSARASQADTSYSQSCLATWLGRGQAVFQPSLEHANALVDLSPSPANKAAYLAALRASGEWKRAAKTALAIYETAAEEKIMHPELWAQVAIALTRADPSLAYQAAHAALDNAVRSAHPNYPMFYALEAPLASRLEDHRAQLEAIRALLAVWDNEPYWLTQAADLLLGRQEESGDTAIQEAIAYLEKAARLEPVEASHYQKLAEAHRAAQDSNAAILNLQRAATLAAEDPKPWLSLAEIYQGSGELGQAEECAEKALRLSPDLPEPHLILAEVAAKHGCPQDALRHAVKVLQIKPGNPQALLLQAEALISLDKHAEALAALEAATVRILPTTDLLLKMIELKRHVHGEKAALESLNSLAAQHPENPQVLIAQAQALAQAGDQRQAIQAAQRALQTSGEELPSDDKARLLYTLGHLLRRNGQLDQALQHLSQAIDYMPDWGDPYIELGCAYHERRQYDLALQTFQQAIAIAPDDSRPYHQAGMTLKETKDYANAEMMLRKAAQLAPDDISTQRQLAAIVALNLVHNPKKFETVLHENWIT